MPLSRPDPPVHLWTLLASLVNMVLGLAVMVSWHLHFPALIQIHPSFAPMQYNTALGFVLGAMGLWSARGSHWQPTLLAGAGAALMGGLTLTQHLFALDFGLDQLFIQHYITVATSLPGRMAPNTALCFALSGCALVMAALAQRGLRSWQPVCLLSALVVGLGLVAMLGYLLDLPKAYGWGNLTQMAVHTAACFIVMGSGLMALGWRSERHGQDWRPWAIGVVSATISITLWQALKNSSGSSGVAADFMLAFGLIMTLALAYAEAKSLKWRSAVDATDKALARLGQEMVEREKAQEEVRQLAFHDALTRLPNRRLFHERLKQALLASKRSGDYGAVMVIDLDNFKPINDTYGHAVGDALLIEVAARLPACLRQTDAVARFGGDEFVVMLVELDRDCQTASAQALQVAQKISTSLSEPYHLTVGNEGESIEIVEHHCSASIGLVLFANEPISQDELFRQADGAMYQAKQAGRNRVHCYTPAPGLT